MLRSSLILASDLGAKRVLVLRNVAGFLKEREVDVTLYIIHQSRIAIPVPDAIISCILVVNRREENIPCAAKASSYIDADNMATAETSFCQATCKEDTVMTSTTDQKFDLTPVFHRRILDSRITVVYPRVTGKINDLFRSSINVLTAAGFREALVTLLLISLEQLLFIVMRNWYRRHCDSFEEQ